MHPDLWAHHPSGSQAGTEWPASCRESSQSPSPLAILTVPSPAQGSQHVWSQHLFPQFQSSWHICVHHHHFPFPKTSTCLLGLRGLSCLHRATWGPSTKPFAAATNSSCLKAPSPPPTASSTIHPLDLLTWYLIGRHHHLRSLHCDIQPSPHLHCILQLCLLQLCRASLAKMQNSMPAPRAS